MAASPEKTTNVDIMPKLDQSVPQSTKGIEKGDDVALKLYRQVEEVDFREKDQLRVLRKIDLYLLPLLMVTGFLQYLDKQALAYAVLYQFQKDLHLVGTQYSWTNSVFYFGWLIWQYPSLLLMQRFSVGKYFASQVFAWDILCFLMAACSNFGGVVTLRFLLGCAESIQMPAFMIISGMYYKTQEQPFRVVIWYGMNGLAIIAGGLFAYGVGHINSSVALWKFPFIICGALSTVWSLVLWFALPSNPASAWFLTPEERAIAIARVKGNQTGVESKIWKKEQAIEALLDPKIWLLAIAGGAGNILGGVGAFASLIIRGFGFTTLQTTLVQLPIGVVEIIALTITSLLATHIRNIRLPLGMLCLCISLAGAIMLYIIRPKHHWPLVAGIWLMVGVIPASFILALGNVSANVGGYTKKITAQGIFFLCYCVGNIVGPQLYTTAPYREGLRANIVAIAVTLLANILNYTYLRWENRKRRDYLELHRHELNEQDYVFHDLTDKQNPFCFNVL